MTIPESRRRRHIGAFAFVILAAAVLGALIILVIVAVTSAGTNNHVVQLLTYHGVRDVQFHNILSYLQGICRVLHCVVRLEK